MAAQPAADTRFWNRIAKRYAAQPVPDQAVYEEKLARTRRYLRPEHRVLDVGCGTGTTALIHAADVAHIRAVDLAPEMIAIARGKAAEANVENVDFEAADLGSLALEPDRYDVVLAHSILHLVGDPEAVLGSLARTLKPGGHMIASVPCIAEFMPLLRYAVPLGQRFGFMPYVNVFSEETFMAWVGGAGLAVQERWLPSPKRGLFLVLCRNG